MSKKIGRNDLCPCGSGKKYKHCHLKFQNASQLNADQKKLAPSGFKELLENYNSVPLLRLLAALQLLPENHGRNARMELLCRETLLQFDSADTKPSASWDRLKMVIEGYRSGMHDEDPLTNAFTEVAIFEQGNYLVFSGLYVGFTEILNQLTECIFLQKNSLPEDFVKTMRSAIGILLFMSNSAANDAGHSPYLFKKGKSGHIEFPDYDKVQNYLNAVFFDQEYLASVCKELQYDISVLDDFIIDPKSPSLKNEDPEQNPVNYKPIISIEDGYLLYMPTGVLSSLVTYIYKKAEEHGCHGEVVDLIYRRQFHLSCNALARMGWFATTIKLPPVKSPISLRESVFQFDNQKFGYICYVQPREDLDDITDVVGVETKDPYQERTEEVVSYLRTLNPIQTFSVLCLYIIPEIGNDTFFMWSKPSVGNQSLAMTYRELWTIAHSPNVNRLTLWKFAKCYSRTSEVTELMVPGGTLDAYAIYLENNGSLMTSDDERPLGGMLMIVNGSSDNFRREVQEEQNEHAVPIFYQGKVAYAKVTHYREYAPIYEVLEVSESFRIVIESYKMPIWITNPQTTSRTSTWGTYVCEAIAFWLNKMQPHLSSYLDQQGFIQFEIEVAVPDEMMNPGQFELHPVAVDEIKIPTEVVPPVIRVSVPFNFIYAVTLPDNSADKLLMKAVLTGIVDYIREAGNETDLDTAIIEDLVQTTLQPEGAKMLLFSDASTNIKLDDRDLPSLRYINDTDISYILDNIASYLPQGYVIPESIGSLKEKIQLCDDIVKALIIQITAKIAEFDGAELLKWLIELNEKCIQVREFREIAIPAKIACFSDFETEVGKLMDNAKNLVTAAHAVRTLIEFVATKIPTGSRWPNFDDIDELLALTNQITDWGALSESMRMGFDDPEMGLLPSGRIGIDKTLAQEAFKPYAIAKTETSLFRDVENFEANYVPARKTGETVETDESKSLDAAFKAEYRIELTQLLRIIGALVNEGFTKGEASIAMEEAALLRLLSTVEGVSGDDINRALGLLTLLERDNVGTPPTGYNVPDIFPWRYNRPISYIRRPLVKIQKDGEIHYYFGYRHLMQYTDNLLSLLYSSKLPGVTSVEMKSWLAGVSGLKGNPFREAVKQWFEENTAFEVIPHEIRMDKGVGKGHVLADKHYGDIDLLVIDHARRIIYPIECKNIQGGRNIHEMKVEMDDYLGRDGNDKKAKMRKHNDRHEWLVANKDSLANIVPDAKNYEVKSFVITADEIPLSYLRKNDLPLPIKSFAYLRKNGVSYLYDL